jgi:3-deoxy-D-manno-octulosonate 8-phosphate phosphatase (KDO 8-P phosphatase)
MIKNKILQNTKKCKRIKLVLTDVDGVLTDGGRYYSKDGEILKKFHVRDGMGINILLRNNIKTIILTKEKSMITKKWAKDMNVFKVYSGLIKKEQVLTKICKKYKINLDEIAFIGDDVNDIEVLKKVGFAAVPNDSIFQVKQIADFVCKSSGGRGCFREISDLILLSKFSTKTKWY